MVRLQKYKQDTSEGKKSFNLQVPMSIWGHFESYCSKMNLKPTEAINLLIMEEIVEAMDEGIVAKNKKSYEQMKAKLNALVTQSKDEKENVEVLEEKPKGRKKANAAVDKAQK